MVVAAAMAASSALPPARIAATPLCEARTCGEATIPRGARDSSQRVAVMKQFYRARQAGNRRPSRGYSRTSEREAGRGPSSGAGCAPAASRTRLTRRPAGGAQDEGVPLRLSTPLVSYRWAGEGMAEAAREGARLRRAHLAPDLPVLAGQVEKGNVY